VNGLRVASKSVRFVVGDVRVMFRTRSLPPGRYKWVAAAGPSEVSSFMVVRATRTPVRPVPVTG
jgi:hypothetical protein